MIKYIENGDLFQSKADVLVNTVNCKGYMGKGIALEFKRRYPFCFPPYKRACEAGGVKPGTVLYVENIPAKYDKKGTKTAVQPSLMPTVKDSIYAPDVAHFATKDHWRGRSQLKWIASGLPLLLKECRLRNVKTIALPQLGCGLGGLDWKDVNPLISNCFDQESIIVMVYVSATRQYGECLT